MAIRRCPYCKAIIDEGSEYCSNCGTQLLFPEDEFIEEEIPGERIVDEEEETDDSSLSEKSNSKRKNSDPKKEERASDLMEDEEETKQEEERTEEEEFEEETSAEEEEKDLSGFSEAEEELEPSTELEEAVETEEKPDSEGQIGLMEDHASETEQEGKKDEEPLERHAAEPEIKEKKRFEEEGQEEIREVVSDEFPDEGKPDQVLEEEFEAAEGEPSKEDLEPAPVQVKEVDFKTEDLERIVESAELEKKEVEEFLKSVKSEREEEKVVVQETTGELPPWAKEIREGPTPDLLSEDEEESRTESADAVFEVPKTAKRTTGEDAPYIDSGIGIPEKVEQKQLPFDEKESLETTEVVQERPPSKFTPWLKSRAFDLFFIAILWAITLWAASRLVEVSVFRLFFLSIKPVIAFYVILLAGYFFLFFYFLGETFGDRLFSRENKSSPNQ